MNHGTPKRCIFGTMDIAKEFSAAAVLIGDRSRAKMLWALLDGRAYTATELAGFADLTRQAASNHLTKLIHGRLIVVEQQGRHRYFRLAGPEIARSIEGIAGLIPPQHVEGIKRPEPKGGLMTARTCYDHLAGELAVRIQESLVAQNIIVHKDSSYQITAKGWHWLEALGIDTNKLLKGKRIHVRPCLDWTERKHHVAGALGKALLDFMIDRDWLRKKSSGREVVITSKGARLLKEHFQVS